MHETGSVQVRVNVDPIDRWRAFDALSGRQGAACARMRPAGPLRFGLLVDIEAVARIRA
jgi:hypothetical protein